MKRSFLKKKSKSWAVPVCVLVSIFMFFACQHEDGDEQRIESIDQEEDATYSMAKILISNGTEVDFFAVKGEKGIGIDEYTRSENPLIKMDDNESFLELYLKIAPKNAEIPYKLIEDYGEGAQKLISGRKITNNIGKTLSVDMKSVSFEIETKENTGETKSSCFLDCYSLSGNSGSPYRKCSWNKTSSFGVNDGGHKRRHMEALTKACDGRWEHKLQVRRFKKWKTKITRTIESGWTRRTKYRDIRRSHKIQRNTKGNGPHDADAASRFWSGKF